MYIALPYLINVLSTLMPDILTFTTNIYIYIYIYIKIYKIVFKARKDHLRVIFFL